MDELLYLFPYAITVKILSTDYLPNNTIYSGDYMIKADICSNPIFALNNKWETSFVLDYDTGLIVSASDPNDWIGTAIAQARMNNELPCYICVGDEPPTFMESW